MVASESGSVREEGVNVLLAQLLRERGLPAQAERRTHRGAPDIRLTMRRDALLILEGKWAGSAGTLDAQLRGRLRNFPEALGLLGVVYPDRLRGAENTKAVLEAASDLQWRLHGSRGIPTPDQPTRTGSVADLADQLRELPTELEGRDAVETAARAVGYALEQAARQTDKHERTAQRVADIIANSDQEKQRAAALRIGCLVLFNAMAFQDRLSAINGNVPTGKEALNGGVKDVRAAWRFICETIDYVPVFDLAIRILDVLLEGPEDVQEPVLDPLLEATRATYHLEGHDLSGRLFHKLLTEAKYTGAYYTSVPAATLLARLVFEGWPPGTDWKDYEFPASLNVADLACGTGTLLMAVAAEASRRHRNAGGRRAAELHKVMVEQVLHGYDVQLSAVHFAATSLAMLNPSIEFSSMNLYVMRLGVEGEQVSLGSLDFLGTNEAEVQLALSPEDMGNGMEGAERVSGNGNQGVTDGVTATLPGLDLAIMNPPFTRSVGGNLLFGSLPQADRRKLQDELASRLKPLEGGAKQASGTAGLGAAFVAAASPKLRPGEGRLALVLPAAVCTGPSWGQTRALIERDFSLNTVIISHDPARWNFSDSTDLSEALLIATRRANGERSGEARTVFVNLWRNPEGALDAHRLARAVASKHPAPLEGAGTALLTVDGQHVGEALSIPESKIAGKKWAGVQFARADLVRSALSLLDDGEVRVPGERASASVPLRRLDAIGDVGPDQRRLVDAFERTNAVTAYPMVEGHETEQRKRLLCSPDLYLSPLVKPRGGQKPGYGQHLWAMAGRILISERLRLDTARVAAMRCDRNVLSNVWWPVKIDDEQTEKALALWLNSSLGLLSVLAERTSTAGGWVKMKKADLEALPVLDPRQLTPARRRALSDLFDSVVEMEFERLPAMAHCPARRALDEGLSRILGLPELENLRELLASEPVVSNRRL